MALTSIAFLLVKFQDDDDEPITVNFATHMFTVAGRGTMNIVDWFDDNSHGNADMTGNAVFGWLPLSAKRSDYTGSGANPAGRMQIFDWARNAASAAGIDLKPFTAIVVVTNDAVDFFGSLNNVCSSATPAGVAASALCQEMIHGLGGLVHSRRDGSDADYADPFDVMSLFASPYAGNGPPGPQNNPWFPAVLSLPIGPGLNAAYMDRCGWLDAGRAAASVGRVTLRPLHLRNLSGALYALAGPYYVEYRPASGWDSGFPSSFVLVHYRDKDTSYLVTNLKAGEKFAIGSPALPFVLIHVKVIDDSAQTAIVALVIRVLMPVWIGAGRIQGTGGMHWSRGASDLFVAADVDGDDHEEILVASNTNGYLGVLKWVGAALTPVWIGAGRIQGTGGMHWSRGASDLFVAANVDGDFDEEILVANNANGYLGVLKWVGAALTPVWIGAGLIQGNGMHWSRGASDLFVVADVDGDGHDEILVANNTNGYLGVLKWVGAALTPVWIGAGLIQGNGMHWSRGASDLFVAADVDGDFHQEILVANNDNGYLGVLKWANGALAPVWIDVGRINGTGMQWSRGASDLFVAADVDGDFHQEILVANNDNGYLGVLKWANGALAPVWIDVGRINGTGMHWSRGASDLFVAANPDGDGQMEILVVNNTNSYLGFLKWNGTALALVWIGASRLEGIGMHWSRGVSDLFIAGDVDGDHCHEMLVANNDNSYVGVLKFEPMA